MLPKKFTATSSKHPTTSKRARVNDPEPEPAQTPAAPTILPFPNKLSLPNQYWIRDRQFLTLMVENSFDEHVTMHLGSTILFR